jgi:hypothetical protein
MAEEIYRMLQYQAPELREFDSALGLGHNRFEKLASISSTFRPSF